MDALLCAHVSGGNYSYLSAVYMITNKFERKVRFGGWSGRSYKEVKSRLKKLWKKDISQDCDKIMKYYLNNK